MTDHYLLDLYNTEILERGIMGPANKFQASSVKQRLTMVQGSCRMYLERIYMTKEIIETVKHNTAQIARIAFTLEEILRLVKEDQERSRKYMEDRKDD